MCHCRAHCQKHSKLFIRTELRSLLEGDRATGGEEAGVRRWVPWRRTSAGWTPSRGLWWPVRRHACGSIGACSPGGTWRHPWREDSGTPWWSPPRTRPRRACIARSSTSSTRGDSSPASARATSSSPTPQARAWAAGERHCTCCSGCRRTSGRAGGEAASSCSTREGTASDRRRTARWARRSRRYPWTPRTWAHRRRCSRLSSSTSRSFPRRRRRGSSSQPRTSCSRCRRSRRSTRPRWRGRRTASSPWDTRVPSPSVGPTACSCATGTSSWSSYARRRVTARRTKTTQTPPPSATRTEP